MDDESGWHELLVGSWRVEVRDAVVARVERATLGQRGVLVRTLADPDNARYAWVESLHTWIVAAIREETGADLDELGSQAAWACYEEVWDALRRGWADGGRLVTVPLGAEPEVVGLLQRLPPVIAQWAGADVAGPVPDPLWLRGRLRVDDEGLWAYLAVCPATSDDPHQDAVRAILARCRAPES